MRRIAVVCALALLALVPAAASAKPGHEEGGDEATLTIGAPPPDIRAGDTWTALLFASRGEQPLNHQNIAVTVSNPFTGRAQTYFSDQTGPGRYEVRVVFPTDGTWEIRAVGGGLVADAPSADVAPAPPGASAWPWVIGAAAALAALGAGVLLARRVRRGRPPAPSPAEG